MTLSRCINYIPLNWGVSEWWIGHCLLSCWSIICLGRLTTTLKILLFVKTLSSLTAKYNENMTHFLGSTIYTNIGSVPSSSPRTSRTNTSSGGGRSLLQRRIKVEPEEEVTDIFPSTCTTAGSSFTASSGGQNFQQLTNNITMPKTTNSAYSSRHITAATLSDLDGIDMMNLPVDLDESPNDPMDINLDEIKLVICLRILKLCC